MLLWLGVLILTTYLAVGVEVYFGSRRVHFLSDTSSTSTHALPSISIIVAARNEVRNIREALTSLLCMSYPLLEIIVVNDRSEDSTGDILEEISKSHKNLKIVNVNELPRGWLGKNHALWLGSSYATGDLLLFTDADVVMSPGTLLKAAGYFVEKDLDHLAVTPELKMPSGFLNMFGATFGFIFAIFTRPWRASDSKSLCHIGIGAFNMVSKEAYKRTGGHRTIALRPDDDLKLGKLIKKAGYKQEMAYGNDLISVEWYSSVREVVLGLEKNIYAGTDYRLWLVVSGIIFNLVASLWPYLAIFLSTGATQWVYIAIVLVITSLAADSARFHGLKPWYALGFPVTIGLFVFIMMRSVCCNISKGGITWRGTFYSLQELKSNKV